MKTIKAPFAARAPTRLGRAERHERRASTALPRGIPQCAGAGFRPPRASVFSLATRPVLCAAATQHKRQRPPFASIARGGLDASWANCLQVS